MKHIITALLLLFVVSTASAQFPKITSRLKTFTTTRDSIYFSPNGAWGSIDVVNITGTDTLKIWVNDDTSATNTWYVFPLSGSYGTSYIPATKIKYVRVKSTGTTYGLVQIKP